MLHNRAADLSGGQKKLLEIGRALMAEPTLLLLDEPVAGVNPTLAREIGEHLRGLRAEGISVLLIEHHLDTIAALCDPVIVMAEGRHLREGTFDEVASDPAVQEAYMGRPHTKPLPRSRERSRRQSAEGEGADIPHRSCRLPPRKLAVGRRNTLTRRYAAPSPAMRERLLGCSSPATSSPATGAATRS